MLAYLLLILIQRARLCLGMCCLLLLLTLMLPPSSSSSDPDYFLPFSLGPDFAATCVGLHLFIVWMSRLQATTPTDSREPAGIFYYLTHVGLLLIASLLGEYLCMKKEMVRSFFALLSLSLSYYFLRSISGAHPFDFTAAGIVGKQRGSWH